MKKNDSLDPNECFSDKAKTLGKRILKIIKIVLILLLIIGVVYVLKSCGIIGDNEKQDGSDNTSVEQEYDDYDDNEIEVEDDNSSWIDKGGEYTTASDVAEYIHTYHELPSNYVKKMEAKAKGWHKGEDPSKYGIMIGGNKWHNNESLLPDDDYYECDVDYNGDGRGPNRLIYTRDGTVYYTNDHYESFTQLY